MKNPQAFLDVAQAGMNYSDYRTKIDRLLSENKTTGENQSEAYINYTKMNVVRMARHDKRTQLTEELIATAQSVQQKLTWLILTEAWCGDAAQNIPVIQQIADVSDHIEIKLILRDAHPDIMDQFLTNGGRSIPKLICLDVDGNVLGTWGPRPAPVQEMTMAYKREEPEDKPPYAKFSEEVHKWYARDKSQTIQKEFVDLLQKWR